MELNYGRFGNGEKTIVLLHYFGGNADSWRWVIQKLQNRFTIIAITLPGFGNTRPLKEPSIFSFAKYINNCIEELKLNNYVLCGHSMSAKLILYADQIGLKYKAKGLVLIAPSPPTSIDMPEEEKDRMLLPPNEDSAITNVEIATFRKLKRKRFATAIKSQLQVDFSTWKWWLNEGMVNDISKRIIGITAPTFVICAKKDPVIPMQDIYDKVLPHLQKPRLIQLGRCGHLIPLEAPRKLSRSMRKIADGLLN